MAKSSRTHPKLPADVAAVVAETKAVMAAKVKADTVVKVAKADTAAKVEPVAVRAVVPAALVAKVSRPGLPRSAVLPEPVAALACLKVLPRLVVHLDSQAAPVVVQVVDMAAPVVLAAKADMEVGSVADRPSAERFLAVL